jgi:hypothetical protein
MTAEPGELWRFEVEEDDTDPMEYCGGAINLVLTDDRAMIVYCPFSEYCDGNCVGRLTGSQSRIEGINVNYKRMI